MARDKGARIPRRAAQDGFGLDALSAVASFARAKPTGAIGAALVVVMCILALAAEVIAPYPPLEFHYTSILAAPGRDFLLGTDNFGRDVLSRVIWGARTSLVVGVAAVAVGQVGGGLWGLASAYLGGKIDVVGQRFVDVLMVFPSLVLALTIVAALGKSLSNVILAIAIAQVPGAARTIRSAALVAKAKSYVEAAQATGCSDIRIMFRHILPNSLAPMLVLTSASLGSAILAEASLSFLGMGVPPPNPSLGAMMSADGRAYLERAPWVAVSAGVAITIAVFGFNLLGDAVRDLWDPRLRRR